MQMKNFVLIFALVASQVFIQGVYGISVGISGGERGNSFSDTLAISASDAANVDVYSIINGATLAQDGFGKGDLHKSYVAKDSNGGVAAINVDVSKAHQWMYSQPTVNEGGDSAALNNFALTAIEADSIICSAEASYSTSQRSLVNVDITKGSLIGYTSSASVDTPSTDANQQFETASGQEIIFGGRSVMGNIVASTTTKVEKGYVTGSHDMAHVFYTIQASQGAALASGKLIDIDTSGENLVYHGTETGDKMSASTKIIDGSASYSNSAYSGSFMVSDPFFKQTLDAAFGKSITLDASFIGSQGDKAIASTEVEKGEIANCVNGVSATRSAGVPTGGAYQYGGVSGKKISLVGTASNTAGLTVNKNVILRKPDNIQFHNLATIIDGTPSVDQGIP